MSKKFLEEIKGMSTEEVEEKLESTQKEYVQMKFDNVATSLEKPIELRVVRRNIARLKTELRQRELLALDDVALAKRSKIRKRRSKA